MFDASPELTHESAKYWPVQPFDANDGLTVLKRDLFWQIESLEEYPLKTERPANNI